MTPLRRASLLLAQSSQAAQVTLKLDNDWHCTVRLIDEHIGRVLFTPPSGLREPNSWAIENPLRDVWTGSPRAALFSETSHGTLSASATQITLSSNSLRALITLEPFGIEWQQFSHNAWQTFCKDRTSYAYGDHARTGTLSHWQSRDQHDQYFGLGDKTGPLNKAGRRLRTKQLDALGYNGENSDPLYKHWPFFMGRRADTGLCYGIYYDTLAECTFDFGQEFDNYHEFYRLTEISDGDLDYYVINGPTIPNTLTRFMQLIGGTAMPPRWSLGYSNTAMALADVPDAQAQIRNFLALAERDQFPLSSFHFGSGYTSRGKQRYVFTWNTDKFPDAKGLLQAFKAAGVRTVANLKPCLLNDHPAFSAIDKDGGFVRDAKTDSPCLDQFWDGWGAHLDFTRKKDRAWWQDNLQRSILDYGFNVGWNDNNEYEIWNEQGLSKNDANDAIAPLPIHRSRALHALLMTEATTAQQRLHAPNERPYTITRAGPPGIQRSAQTWSGDNTTNWHTLRWNQRMGLTMSLSGMFNIGHDIGGFGGPPPGAELLTRWTQACCLLPRMIMNSWKADGSVNTPWLYPEATANIRAAIALRLRLMPYLYTLMWKAHSAHEPIVRPTFYHFPEDKTAWQDNDEMMIGPDLLVAPVFEEGGNTRTLYLPRGAHAEAWYDFHTQQYFAGGQTIQIDAPLERLPLFVRAGAMLPMTDAANDLNKTEEPTRALHLYPRHAANQDQITHAELFEDDGLQTGWGDNNFVKQQFTLSVNAKEIRLRSEQTGHWPLPYSHMRVVLPKGETRALHIENGSSVKIDAS